MNKVHEATKEYLKQEEQLKYKYQLIIRLLYECFSCAVKNP